MIAAFILPLPFFICLNFACIFFTKKKFGFCIPFTLIISSLTLYFSQLLCNTYRVGYYALLAAALFGIVSFIIISVKEKRITENYFSTGFWVFLIIFAFYVVVDLNRTFLIFDEYYFWGPALKESLRLDSFYSDPSANLWMSIHKDYPPFMTVFEVLWCKLGRGFSESGATLSVHVFNLGILLCWPIEKISEKLHKNPFWKMLYAFMFLIMFLMLILFLDPYGERVSTSILVDITVPLLFVASMFIIYSKEAYGSVFGVVSVSAIFSAVLLTKQAGIFFVLTAELYLMIKVIFGRTRTPGKKVRNILLGPIPIAVSLLVQQTWKYNISGLEIEGQFAPETITVKDYLDVLTGNTTGLQHETVSNYFRALFNLPISSVKWLPVTYFVGFIIVIALVIVIGIFFKRTFSKGEAWNIGITLTVGTVGYACAMAVSYAFFFNEGEMKILASYERYMSMFLMGEILFLVWVLIDNLSHKTGVFSDLRKMVPIAGCAVLLFDPLNVRFILPQGVREDIRAPYRNDAGFVEAVTSPDEKIFVLYDNNTVSPHWWGAYQAYMQYFLNDRFISRRAVEAFSYDYSDPSVKNYILDVLDECDSIYVRNANAGFNEAFGKNVSGGEFDENTVYRIVKDTDDISFVKK